MGRKKGTEKTGGRKKRNSQQDDPDGKRMDFRNIMC